MPLDKENYVVIGTAGGVGAIILLFVVGIIGIAVCRKKGQCYYRRTGQDIDLDIYKKYFSSQFAKLIALMYDFLGVILHS